MAVLADFGARIKSAWNVFRREEDRGYRPYRDYGMSYSSRPHAPRPAVVSSKTIVGAIYTRLSIDVAAVAIQHVRLDSDGRYAETINSGLNNCLTVEANIDQAARHFRQDLAMTLFDEGTIAIVPVDTSDDPDSTGSYDIQTMRVGKIVQWAPRHVRVKLYNDDPKKGYAEEVTVSKSSIAIIENPLYSVMNETNSTLQRLLRKLSLLDAVDEQSSSGKLDIIIQLPYVIKSEARRQQADKRRNDIEMQLKGSQYGVAYTDGTERITQLNRPAENNLMKQIEYLTAMLYGQLGLTEEVFNGTADEKTMVNYYNRTIEPVLAAIVEGMRRAFLTKTARTQGQSIEYYRDPFKLVSVSDIAEIADKFTRNEVFSTNEVRAILGVKPSKDPKADELRNKNLPPAEPAPPPQPDPQLPVV